MREERQRLDTRGKPVLDRSADPDGASTSRLQPHPARIGIDSWRRAAVAFVAATVAASVVGCASSSPSRASSRDRATPPAHRLTRSTPVTPTGVGPLVVGMTYHAAERVLGASLVIDDYADTGGSCVAVSFSGAASTLSGIGAEGRCSPTDRGR